MKIKIIFLLALISIFLVIPVFAVNNSGNQPPASNETGTIVLHGPMQVPGLKPREVVVWLPPYYHQDPNLRYPVLYMHDGQNVLDPSTSYSGVSWRAHLIIDSLAALGDIEPMIIVGIYNTPDRMEEYLPGPMGELYMDFIVNHLKPFIDSTYRSMPQKESTFTAGASAGGTIAFMLAWQYDEVFSKAICMSPALKYLGDDIKLDYVSYVESYQGPMKNSFFYLDNGGIGIEQELQPGIDEMMKVLSTKGYHEGEHFVWIHDPKAPHHETSWSHRLPNAIQIILSH